MDRWISVEEHLPEPGEEVLLLAHGWVGRLHYIGKLAPSPSQEGFFGKSKASEWTIWGWSYFREPKVTHWMPLPKPPENGCPSVCGCTGKPCSECQPGPCEHRVQEAN